MRGLSSSRQGARQGFAAALATLLAAELGPSAGEKGKAGKKGSQQGQGLLDAEAALALVDSVLPVSRSMSGMVSQGG